MKTRVFKITKKQMNDPAAIQHALNFGCVIGYAAEAITSVDGPYFDGNSDECVFLIHTRDAVMGDHAEKSE